MLFNSFVFVVFLFLVLGVYRVAPRAATKYLILASSYFFYGWWDWRFLSLILASTVVDYCCGLAIERASRPKLRGTLLTVSMVFNLGLLGVFKYFNFFGESLARLLGWLGMDAGYTTLYIVLPVGISFYTFQTMSYTIDVWRGKLKAERNFIAFAAFVSFFPQLVAGPIERASVLLPQIREKISPSTQQIKDGLWLILWGYFLKVFMADNLAPVVDGVYSGAGYTGADVFVATYAFAFQILGDFAGYSSIAIGVAKLFGINLTENFRFPYFTTNPSAFWQNWHISLSTWLRDYLYIPLGGNRGGSLLTYRNLLLTMILGGLWHGAAWNFLLWGLFHGLMLVGFRLFMGRDERASGVIWLVRVFIMFHLTCLGWLFFRTPDMGTGFSLLATALTDPIGYTAATTYDLTRLVFYTGFPLLLMILQFRRQDPHSNPLSGELGGALTCTAMLLCLAWAGSWGSANFIYFQF